MGRRKWRWIKESPHDRYVFYDLQVEAISPLYKALHRLLPSWKAPSAPRESLWVSRNDATDMHELGSVEIESGRSDIEVRHPDALEAIDWLPDEKHLSFVYKNMLYTVPIE